MNTKEFNLLFYTVATMTILIWALVVWTITPSSTAPWRGSDVLCKVEKTHDGK